MKIVILGNGIGGVTAARFIRKLSDHEVVIISRETDYFFSRTALMYLYMGHMRFEDIQPYDKEFWIKNRIHLVRAEVKNIDFEKKTLKLNPEFKPADSAFLTSLEEVTYDRLILALGSAPNKFGWPGQDLKRVQGLYTFQDVQSMEMHSGDIRRAVVVGGGLIGIEMAEMFHSRHIPVTLLVRESSYWDMVLPREESSMIGRHILRHGIDLQLETELKEIIGNQKDEVKAVVTSKEEIIDCQFVGLTAGVHPNVRWLKESVLEIDRGILVNDHLQTNVRDVYAVGDCAQVRNPRTGRRNIEAVWYTGRMMGEVAAYNICDHLTTYDPGIWFNSAKFLDIEYQVYGDIPTQMPAHMDTLYWEHEDGEKSIRLVFKKNSFEVVGFNLMGIRFRHEVCEKWIREKCQVEEVLRDLALASFDPEFFPPYHQKVIETYNQQFNKSISIHTKRRFNLVSKFLNQ